MSRTLPVAVVVMSLSGCFKSVPVGYQDAGMPTPPDRLTLTARYCTAPPDPTGFPVRVVLLVDQSNSMCVSDPPGSSAVGNFCPDVLGPLAPGLPNEPARVRALKQLFQQFRQQPNVNVTLVPFATAVAGVWPPGGGFGNLADPTQLTSATARVQQLQAELGGAADFQGALEFAHALIAADIARFETTAPEQLPRTRYVVVLVSDGNPYPRCAANDGLPQYADENHPERVWADAPGALGPGSGAPLPNTYCNTASLDPDGVAGFVGGNDRNQNLQLFSPVDALMALKGAHHVGDIRFHTVLTLNQTVIASCGTRCEKVYGDLPGVALAQYPQAVAGIARWLMQNLADRGNGTFTEFTDTPALANLALTRDYTSFASQNIEKSFILRALTSVPGETERELDSDGDGLADALETPSSATHADTDDDCFDDGFEVRHATEGFDPNVKDSRGCDPSSPLTPGCACRDNDGDGLSQFAELYLGTSATMVDSDADGLSDGVEARWGLDPLHTLNPLQDTDSDLMSDLDEVRAGSDPTHADPGFSRGHTVRYQAVASPQPDGSNCYDVTIENVQRLEGYNLYRLEVAAAPQTIAATDFGVWSAACAWAHFTEGDPLGSLSVAATDFLVPSRLSGDPAAYADRCAGTPPP